MVRSKKVKRGGENILTELKTELEKLKKFKKNEMC